MATKKSDLIEKIKRRLGAPMVKVELHDEQINDAIDYTRQKYIKWAIGQSVQECFFTLMLSAGQATYELSSDITEILSYDIKTTGSIHTLFTIENYMYNQGMYDMLLMQGTGAGDGYTLISYHIARQFLDTVKRYTVDAYDFVYHPYSNTITFSPTPPSGGSLTINSVQYNTPGFVLIRAYKIEGSDNDIFTQPWVLDYATAQCKMMLGRVRSKFTNFTALGDTSLGLDGENLISEAQTELEKLEEQLRLEESYTGYDISVG